MSVQALSQEEKCAGPGLHVVQAAGETLRGGFCWRLKHCGRIATTLLTEIISHVIILDTADGESEICPRPKACEAIRDPSASIGCIIDQQFRSLPWFLLIPAQVVCAAR